MFRLPNFFLVVMVKPVAWRFPLILPVPLFLVDELLEIGETAYYFLGRKHVPRKWRETASRGIEGMRRVWRSIRRAGTFTLVDVEASGVRVWVRLF
ncbi:MAG: hypothetical protein DDT37_01530 [Firmicutes bacterium]|nr:hypothetical protein [candidate division NPL-UPA2 bacterium]